MQVLHRPVELAGFNRHRDPDQGTGTRSFSSSNQLRTTCIWGQGGARGFVNRVGHLDHTETLPIWTPIPHATDFGKVYAANETFGLSEFERVSGCDTDNRHGVSVQVGQPFIGRPFRQM